MTYDLNKSSLLVEASLFGYDTFASVADYPSTPALPWLPAGNAVERGWAPVPELLVPPTDPSQPPVNLLESPGVDLADIATFANRPGEDPVLPPGLFTSAAHFYTGNLEGRNTLVITYRSTDEANEFGFQGLEVAPGVRGWDLYFAAHKDATEAALDYAASNGIKQILLSGHSLGGIIAELSAARLLGTGAEYAGLADKTLLVTFGSPGSTEVVEGVEQLNLVHTDDFVAQLSALSPLFIAGGAAREGLDLEIDRTEVSLPRFRLTDLDTPEELIAASQIPGIGAEHSILVYIDSAMLLDSAEDYVPGVSDALDDPFRWLGAELDRTIIGGENQSVILGTKGNDLIVAVNEESVLFGGRGNDVLIGSDGNNTILGDRGNDIMVGGPGDDTMAGGRGQDTFYIGGGNTFIDGGKGVDRAIFDGDEADFDVTIVRNTVFVTQDGTEPSAAAVRTVELFEFDDQLLAFERGQLKPVEPAAPAAVASVQLDDLVIASDVA